MAKHRNPQWDRALSIQRSPVKVSHVYWAPEPPLQMESRCLLSASWPWAPWTSMRGWQVGHGRSVSSGVSECGVEDRACYLPVCCQFSLLACPMFNVSLHSQGDEILIFAMCQRLVRLLQTLSQPTTSLKSFTTCFQLSNRQNKNARSQYVTHCWGKSEYQY